MSKITITLEIQEFLCDALNELRDMDKTKDYSSLLSVVERVQHHGYRMESAVHRSANMRRYIKDTLDNKDMSDSKKLKEIKKHLKEYNIKVKEKK